MLFAYFKWPKCFNKSLIKLTYRPTIFRAYRFAFFIVLWVPAHCAHVRAHGGCSRFPTSVAQWPSGFRWGCRCSVDSIDYWVGGFRKHPVTRVRYCTWNPMSIENSCWLSESYLLRWLWFLAGKVFGASFDEKVVRKKILSVKLLLITRTFSAVLLHVSNRNGRHTPKNFILSHIRKIVHRSGTPTITCKAAIG